MPGAALHGGDSVLLLESASRTPATPFKVSEQYWLIDSGGLIIEINVTDVSGGGSIDAVRILDNDGGTYDAAIEFSAPPLPITAVGRYKFIVAPGASAPAAWTAYLTTIPPTQGKIEIQHHDANAIVYTVGLECVRH